MKIYTKTGDKGETGLYSGERVPKNHPKIEALGSIDELNAILGTINLPQLREIQKDLMLINASIAGYKGKVLGSRVQRLEQEIDKMQEELPELKNFILPQGQLHFARAVCRRAERRIVVLGDSGHGQNDVKKYLNRLSDYLFCLARWVNFKNGRKEKVWIG